MPVRYYPAIIEKGPRSFGATFPDFPGCVTAAESVQQTVIEAEEALRLHVRGMLEDGDELPKPSDIQTVTPPPRSKEVARVLVRVAIPGKSVRLNISMDEDLLRDVDAAAAANGLTRSAYLAMLAQADRRKETR